MRSVTLFLAYVMAHAGLAFGSEILEPGQTDSFVFSNWDGPDLDIYVAHPGDIDPGLPVVFVHHGAARNGDVYRDNWIELAETCRFIAVAPNFSREDFPGGAGYNLAGLGRDDLPNAFEAIEPLFDAVKDRYQLTADQYMQFGHSAGSQFVHRYVLMNPAPRLNRAIAANAGWYTLPDENVIWPYGLKDAPVDPQPLDWVLSREVTILLGEADNDPNANLLRQTPEAVAQGPGRLQRGQFMYDVVTRWADALDMESGWGLETVPGVAHDNGEMAPAAAYLLLKGRDDLTDECQSLIEGHIR